jgi:hypothetical protein
MRSSTVIAATGSALALLLPADAQARTGPAPHRRATIPHQVYVAPFGSTPRPTTFLM